MNEFMHQTGYNKMRWKRNESKQQLLFRLLLVRWMLYDITYSISQINLMNYDGGKEISFDYLHFKQTICKIMTFVMQNSQPILSRNVCSAIGKCVFEHICHLRTVENFIFPFILIFKLFSLSVTHIQCVKIVGYR